MNVDKFFLQATKKIALNSERNRKRRQHANGEYSRPKITLQDEISKDPAKIKERLKNYDSIDRDDYKYVQPGTFIRYLKKISNNRVKYCHGGMMVINGYPAYWILKNKLSDGKVRMWSVQLQGDNIYYRKKIPDIPEKSIQEICKMVLSGEYRLIKAVDLLKPEFSIKLLGKDDTHENTRRRNNEDSYNSDEESSTMDSDEDSYDQRRPTIVELIHS